MNILDKLANLPVVGNKMKMMIAERTGGMQESAFLREYTKKRNKVDVGMYSYGGCFSNDFNNGGEVQIGRYCSFASGVHYFGANHPMDHISMSPYFYNKAFRKDVKDIERFKLTIGNDCWIGYGVIITSGCKNIGNGAVVGAGAIVTEDIPPYAIAVGAPAKVIRYRFDQETIDLIEKSRWWEKTPDQCMKYYDSMADPGEFCRRLLEDEQ